MPSSVRLRRQWCDTQDYERLVSLGQLHKVSIGIFLCLVLRKLDLVRMASPSALLRDVNLQLQTEFFVVFLDLLFCTGLDVVSFSA